MTTRTSKSTRTTSRLIDWDAYRNLQQQLKEANPQPTSNTPNHETDFQPPADNGTELLARQVQESASRLRTQALGNLGMQLGNLQGQGLAPVQREDPQPLLSAFKRHDQLREKLGDRLDQQYRQRLSLDAQHQKLLSEQLLQQQKGEQQLQKQLLEAATNQTSETETSQSLPDTKPATPHRRTASGRGRTADRPFRIADTDGSTIKGYWNLTPDTAAQILQTAIDLGDQAQIDYVTRLAGTGSSADRKTTTARLMALQQKALMGNADARQRMASLLSAIIPSLRGKKVIDGILKANYSRK